MTRLLTLVAGLALSSLASAQTTKPAQPAQPPALSGPKVTESGVPGEQRQFAPGRTKGKEQMGSEIPHRLFLRALESLRDPEAAADIRLTADQNTQVRAINDEFMKSVAAYRDAHKAEAGPLLEKLSPEDRRKAHEFLKRGSLGSPRQGLDQRKTISKKDLAAAPADKPDGDAMMPPDGTTGTTLAFDAKAADEARNRLKELMEGAPSPADTHARIFALLTDPQKKAFQAELEKARKEMGSPRALEKAEKKADGKLAKKNDALNPDDPRIPQRLRDRLKDMTPQQREQALQRFRDRRNGKEGEAKPAPSTTDIPLPEPR